MKDLKNARITLKKSRASQPEPQEYCGGKTIITEPQSVIKTRKSFAQSYITKKVDELGKYEMQLMFDEIAKRLKMKTFKDSQTELKKALELKQKSLTDVQQERVHYLDSIERYRALTDAENKEYNSYFN